jgi:GMP synthase (glutamine-hydrolysing)
MEKPSKQVSIIQHHLVEGLGIIADVLNRAAIAPQYIRSFEGQSVPREIGDDAGLIVMGGPQSVYEQNKFPYLRQEMRLIEDALKRSKPVLGICLGSQLLAATLGANVYPGRQKEIGWHHVTLANSAVGSASVPACGRDLFSGEPGSFMAFHWHGDIFDLPRGATLLASSALTAHQAFRYGKNAYGLLFHLEVTLPQINTMVATFADELQSAGINGSAIKLNSHAHLPTLQKIGVTFFQRWASLLQ